MKIYYIHHSCFIVESDNSFLIFDYYKEKPYQSDFDFNFKDLISRITQSNKVTYVFASHSHSDHYNSEILAWNNSRNIYYILSDDIKIYKQIKNCYFVKPNEEFLINDIKINTFGSTDSGVSFMVNIENSNIFHAGDLNWWKWNDDSPSEEEEMESAFKGIINDILRLDVNIDIAFFPVDKRLEENFDCGGKYFINKLAPKIFIPMHFWDDFSVIHDFKQSLSDKDTLTKITEFKHANELLISL
nr:MBL fold metallo-hydrolase [Sedimentibacter sp.]